MEINNRVEAVATILGIAGSVGANGLGLPWSMVQSAPDDARQALLVLGVTAEEIEEADRD